LTATVSKLSHRDRRELQAGNRIVAHVHVTLTGWVRRRIGEALGSALAVA
jgi:hypothetical protein